MHHAALMRVRQGFGDVAQDADHLPDGKRTVAQSRTQRIALDERHRVERQPVRVARRMDRHDVRMRQRRDGLDLALEPLDADTLGEFRRQDLDHDLALEARLLGHKDLGHPSATEFALDDVAAGQGGLKLIPQLRHDGWVGVGAASGRGQGEVGSI